MKKVLGLGNALTDMLLQVSEGDLRELGYPKGSMNLITKQEAAAIQQRFASVRKRLVAGGSACNAISTIASLGGKAAFIGKIGNDEVGDFYREDMLKRCRVAVSYSSPPMENAPLPPIWGRQRNCNPMIFRKKHSSDMIFST